MTYNPNVTTDNATKSGRVQEIDPREQKVVVEKGTKASEGVVMYVDMEGFSQWGLQYFITLTSPDGDGSVVIEGAMERTSDPDDASFADITTELAGAPIVLNDPSDVYESQVLDAEGKAGLFKFLRITVGGGGASAVSIEMFSTKKA